MLRVDGQRTGVCGVLILCAMGLQGSARSGVAWDDQKISVEFGSLTARAANPQLSLASKSKGCVVGWGYRDSFCVHNPPDGNDFVDIAATEDYCVALKSDGTIVGWGFDFSGRLVPNDGNDFVAIAGGSGHSLALKSDGSIVGWGRNNFGQASPPSGNDFVAIAAGGAHSLALKSDGSIVGWGFNPFGEARAPGGNDFVAIAAGGAHSLALKTDGSIVGWGWNHFSQAEPPTGNNFVAIAGGETHSLALKSDGSICAWGGNDFGEAEPPHGTGFVAIDADLIYSLALRSDGSIMAWGNKTRPTTPPDGKSFVAIAAGRDCALALSKAPLVRPQSQNEGNKRGKQKQSEQTTQGIAIKDVSALKCVEPPHKIIRLITEDKISVDLVYIRPGSFVMGRDVGLGEKAFGIINAWGMVGKYPDDWPARKVTITNGFYVGKYKVTAAQFCKFLNAIPNPQDYVALNEDARIEIKDGAYVPKAYCEDCEVNVVHWRGAAAFCQWLTANTGITVRLPTEAEWEFVVRGPGAQPYSLKGGERVGWTESTRGEIDEEKRPYAWNCPPIDPFPRTVTPDGVVGMGGFVGEWCSDFYTRPYLKNDVIDPKGPQGDQEKYHVLRWGPRGTKRQAGDEVIGDAGIYGFRIVVEPPADKPMRGQSPIKD